MTRSVWISLAILIAVAIAAPLIGSSHIELRRALAGISPDHEILFYARLPRVLLALLAGSALSLTGVLFQCLLRDPLAEPYTLGISSGGSVGAVIGICFGLPFIGLLSLTGAGLALLIVLGIAFEGRRLSSFTLLLAGVTMNSISLAIVLFLHNLATFSQSFAISRWLMGGLDAVAYSTLAWLALAVIPVCLLVIARIAPVEPSRDGRRMGLLARPFDHHLHGARLHCGIVFDRNRHIANRTHRIRRTHRPPRPAPETRRRPPGAHALFVPARRSVSSHLRHSIANRNRAHRNSRRSRHRVSWRTLLHLAPSLQTEKPVAVILIGGGARSGKSRYALEKARAIPGTRAFLATAEPSDGEMSARIRAHREERGEQFTTIEEPIELPRVIIESKFDVLVVDCLTLWLSNLMFANRTQEIEALEPAAQAAQGTIIFVTNEVGSGIVPTDSALSRDFRDRAGILNQRIAAISQEVYFMVFGQPLRIK